MLVERALRQPAGLHDVAHRHHRVAALGELGEGRRPDRFDRRALLALGNDRHGGHHPYRLSAWGPCAPPPLAARLATGGQGSPPPSRLALGGHRPPPAMPSTIFQASSAAGRTSLPDSAAR